MIGKIGVIAGNRSARVQVLGFQRIDVSGEDEFGLCLAGCGAVFKFSEGCLDLTFRAYRNMDVVALQHAGFDIRGIGRTAFQALDRGGLVAEGIQKLKSKRCPVEHLFGQLAYRFFNCNGVQCQALVKYSFINKLLISDPPIHSTAAGSSPSLRIVM